MVLISSALTAALALLSGPPQDPPPAPPPPDALAEFEAVCLAGVGAPETVEAAALERGYAAVEAEQEDKARVQGADPPPRVWARAHDGGEARVVSAPGRLRLQGPWVSVHRCYLAAPGNFDAVRARLATLTGVDPFRQGESSVFAWIERDEGRESVRQGTFERGLSTLMRERGLRAIILSQGRDRQVILSYTTPR